MSAWKDRAGTAREAELRETLQAAHDALSEMARTRGLDPNAEQARQRCAEVLAKMKKTQRLSLSL